MSRKKECLMLCFWCYTSDYRHTTCRNYYGKVGNKLYNKEGTSDSQLINLILTIARSTQHVLSHVYAYMVQNSVSLVVLIFNIAFNFLIYRNGKEYENLPSSFMQRTKCVHISCAWKISMLIYSMWHYSIRNKTTITIYRLQFF